MLSELSDGKNNSDLKCQGAPRKRTGQRPVLFRGAPSKRTRYAANLFAVVRQFAKQILAEGSHSQRLWETAIFRTSSGYGGLP